MIGLIASVATIARRVVIILVLRLVLGFAE
jgi:hypothetical protein